MQLNGQLHTSSALPQGTAPLLSIEYISGWAPESVCTQRCLEPSLETVGIEQRFVGCPVRSPVVVTTV